ncbi:MAG: cytochrome c biogenesis protein CcsA, partial [Thermodesulfobacteriota bacterium]
MKPFILFSLALYGLGFAANLACLAGGGRALRRLPGLSAGLLTLGLAGHTAALVVRIHATGHAPMASMYETLVFYSWCVAAVSLVVVWRYGERTTEVFTMSMAMLALVFALANEKPGGPLTLVLRTVWFEIHVTSSFAAYAFFTLAFSGAALYLITGARGGDQGNMRKYQDIAARGVLWGFFLFSASMFAGAVWGYLAWGAYWLWEPKVIWSFIVWFYYAGAMHAWYVSSWRG